MGIFMTQRINALHKCIPLAYIYLLFYQHSSIDDFKSVALLILDKVICEKEKLNNELNNLIASDIRKLLADGLMLTALLSDVESDWTILM